MEFRKGRKVFWCHPRTRALTSKATPVLCSISFQLTMIRSYKGTTPTIPQSCYVDDSAQIIGDVILGEHASIWMNAVLRGDVHSIRVGAHSNVQDCSVLHGMKEQYGVFLGEYVTVGHTVTLHGCTIEDRCLIGMGSIILNGAHIGAGSIIAAGTLIPEKTMVEPGSLWMGSPGKVSPQAGRERSGNDHALRQELSGVQGFVPAGEVAGAWTRNTGALRPRLWLVVARIKIVCCRRERPSLVRNRS